MRKSPFGTEFYASAAALRAETDTPMGFAYVANTGLFTWDEDSTATDDGDTVIKIDSVTTGRYLHVEKNPA